MGFSRYTPTIPQTTPSAASPGKLLPHPRGHIEQLAHGLRARPALPSLLLALTSRSSAAIGVDVGPLALRDERIPLELHVICFDNPARRVTGPFDLVDYAIVGTQAEFVVTPVTVATAIVTKSNFVAVDGWVNEFDVAVVIRSEKTDTNGYGPNLMPGTPAWFADNDLFQPSIVRAAVVGEVVVPLGRGQRVRRGAFTAS